MPRQARKKSRTGIYHIMIRGINRQTIFETDEDYINLSTQCKKAKKKVGLSYMDTRGKERVFLFIGKTRAG